MKHWGHGWVPGDEAAEPAEWGSVCWENSLVVQEIWRRWFTGKGRSLSTDQTVHLRSLNLDPVILSYNEHYPLAEEKKKRERRQCCTSLSVASCSRACLCKSYIWRRTTIFICNASKLLHISRTKLIHNTHLHKNTTLFSASCVGGRSTSPML